MDGFLNLKRFAIPREWPENSGDIFLSVALDQTQAASDRLLAMTLAGDLTAVNDAIVL